MSSDNLENRDRWSYEPLDATKQQIRLLSLDTSSYGELDPVRCSVRIFDLETAPPFTCLSYVWGPETPTQKVMIGDHICTIRQNLHDFLKVFRRLQSSTGHDSDQFLWIDQITINQANDVERSQQVKMMGSIYKTAAGVIVWLGNGDETVQCRNWYTCTTYEAAKRFAKASNPSNLLAILQNKYFGRLWIIQEFLLARHVRLLVRDQWVFGESDVSEHQGQSIESMAFPPEFLTAHTLLAHRRNLKLPLRPLLAFFCFGSSACVDPRDKLYGLLGIMDQKECNFSVDYSRLPQEVFTDIALLIFRCLQRETWDQSKLRPEVVLARWAKHLRTLAIDMGCTPAQLSSLKVMLDSLCSKDRLACFTFFDFPISAMGFDQADSADRGIDRWWFDFQGEKYFVECVEDATVDSFNDPTRKLLSDHWEKYLPPLPSLDAE